MKFLSLSGKKFLFTLLIFVWSFSLFSSPEKLGIYKPIHFGNFQKMLIYQNYAILLTWDQTLCVYSIENDKYTLLNYKLLSAIPDYIPNGHILIYKNRLYFACKDYMAIFDVSNLPEISFIKTLPNINKIRSINIKNDILAVGHDYNGLIELYSLQDPINPVKITQFSDPNQNEVSNIYFTNSLLIYTARERTQGNVNVIDMSNPQNPQPQKKYTINYQLYDSAFLDGKYLFLLNEINKTYFMDFSNPSNLPANPIETNINFAWYNIISTENNIILLHGYIAEIMNKPELSHPDNMQMTPNYSLNNRLRCAKTKEKGNGMYYIYSYDNASNKKTIISFDDQNISFTEVEIDQKDFTTNGELAHIGNYIYIPAEENGIAIYKIDAGNIPQFVKFDDLIYDVKDPKGIHLFKRQNQYLAAYSYSNTVLINIDNRESPQTISKIDFPSQAIIIDGNYLFAINNTRLGIFDITDLANPQILSDFQLPSYEKASMHYYQNHLYIGKLIIDVSDKTNPKVVNDSMDAKFVCGKDNLLIATSSSNQRVLKVYKLNNPANPEKIQTIFLKGSIYNRTLTYKEGFVCLNYKCQSTYNNETIFYSFQGETLVPAYYFNGKITDFIPGNKFMYAIQKKHTPFVILGKEYIIPHIATTWGWETYLIADNLSSKTETFLYSINDYLKAKEEKKNIGGGKQIAIPFQFGQTGNVVIPFDSHLSFKVSYHHTGEHGIAEFLLDNHVSNSLNLFTPQYLANELTWMGIAVANTGVTIDFSNFSSYKNDGTPIESTQKDHQYPYTRYASVLSKLFPSAEWKDIAKVKSGTNYFASGITISGNGNSRLLFTPATYEKQRSDKRYIPHIDVKGYWNTYLILDNPTDSDITVNIKLYSNGSVAKTDTKTIPAKSNVTVLVNDYNNENIDCGEISGCGSDLIVRLAYMFKNTGATAEFLIDGDNIGSYLAFDLPAYRADVLTWWGLAIMNPEDSAKDITLTAYKDGQAIDTATIHINAHSKKSALLGDLFSNLNGQTIDRVVAETASGNILGLNICGANQDRYLFTPAITKY